MYEKYVLKKMKYNIDKQDLDKKKKKIEDAENKIL